MTLKKSMIIIMVLMLSFCVGIGGFSLVQLDNVNAESKRLSEIWMPATEDAQAMKSLMASFHIGAIMQIFSENAETVKRYETRMTAILQEYAPHDKNYERLIASPEEQALYDNVVSTREKYLRLYDEAKKLSIDRRHDAGDLLEQEVVPAYHAMLDALDGIVKLNVDGSYSVADVVDATNRTARYLIWAVLALAVLFGSGLAFLLVRQTMRNLGKDPGELNRLARQVVQGNYDIDDGKPKKGVYAAIVEMVQALKTNIETARRDSELAREQSRKAEEASAQAAAAGRDAQAKTRAMLTAADELEKVGETLSAAAQKIAEQVAQSDKSAEETAARLSEAATGLNQMSATVQEVAKNASAASDMSAATRSKAQDGAHVVQQAVASIEQAQEQTLHLKSDMGKLNEHAQSISQVMGVISDIADQTNLLALNAAIEAARAGEAGRGFAVVADEVRKLAEKTMASTSEVGNAITAIQQSTAQSMRGLDSTVMLITQATDLAKQSGAALTEIVSNAETTADEVQAIAAASEEQSASSEQINTSITEVNSMSQQTAAAMGEASAAVAELAKQSQHLAKLIETMKSK